VGAFGRFTLIFILIVLVCFGLFLYFSGRLTFTTPKPAPNSSMAPLQPIPATPAQPTAPLDTPLDNPPDISGLNIPELNIPGADLPTPAPPVSSSPSAPPGDYVNELSSRHLHLPIDNLQANQLYDSFNDARTGSKHEAIDIMEPTGTPVHAIDEGNIAKLFTSKKGGLTVYQFDDQRKYCFYYAHLDRYADNIKEGMLVRAGDVIGYVGSTGDANAANPHLHFALSVLGPDRKYWKGIALDPYPVLVKVVQQK